MKKLAVCLPGHIRTWKKCVNSLKEFIKNSFPDYEVDYYLSIWDNEGTVKDKWKFQYKKEWISMNSITDEDINELILSFNPKEFSISSFSDWNSSINETVKEFIERKGFSNHFKEFKAAFFGQFYSWKRCWDQISDPYEYDIIMKSRFDCFYGSPIEIEEGKVNFDDW